jgi:hypothetical protein
MIKRQMFGRPVSRYSASASCSPPRTDIPASRRGHAIAASACHYSLMAGDADDLELVRREFSAEDGSFLLQLRIDLHWDRHAFSRLEQAMRRVCARLELRRSAYGTSSAGSPPEDPSTWTTTGGPTCDALASRRIPQTAPPHLLLNWGQILRSTGTAGLAGLLAIRRPPGKERRPPYPWPALKGGDRGNCIRPLSLSFDQTDGLCRPVRAAENLPEIALDWGPPGLPPPEDPSR